MTLLKKARPEPHPTLSALKDAKENAKSFYPYEALRSSFFALFVSLR
jgi:hypothetical protein